MFKLIKILNSGTNVPEIIKLRKRTDCEIDTGVGVDVDADGYAINGSIENRPRFISACRANESDSSVSCYKVSSDMIFETTISGSPEELGVGMLISTEYDLNGAQGRVTNSSVPGHATLYDLMGAKQDGDTIAIFFN